MKRLVCAVAVVAVLGVTSVALAAGGLSGAYKTKITGAPAFLNLDGTWVLTFTTSHHYKVSHNGTAFGQGTDSISGNTITFSPGAMCTGVGKYKFKRSGKHLKFTLVTDSCPGRITVLAHAFTKV